MTEAEWNAGTFSTPLFEFLRSQKLASQRQRFLLALACCHAVRPKMSPAGRQITKAESANRPTLPRASRGRFALGTSATRSRQPNTAPSAEENKASATEKRVDLARARIASKRAAVPMPSLS